MLVRSSKKNKISHVKLMITPVLPSQRASHVEVWLFFVVVGLNRLLTHLPLVPHICISDLVGIDLDNALSPDRRQVIISTNA